MSSTVQTTYGSSIDNAYAGLPYGRNPSRVITALAETTAIGVGLAVTTGTTGRQGVKGGSGTFLGITQRRLDNEGNAITNAPEYKVGAAMAVMEWGDIYVNLTTTGTVGDAIKFVDATGVIAAGTAGTGETAIAGGRLQETKGAAGIALIRIKEGN